MFRKRKREPSIVESVFKKTLTINILNTLTWAIGALVDSAVIGQFLGVNAIAAYGLVWPMTLVYALVGSILSGGSRNLYTVLAGKGNVQEANHTFTLACSLSAGASLVLMAVTYAFMQPLAGLLGASGGNSLLQPLVCQYLSGFIIGLPFDNTARILAGYMGMDSDHKRVIAATIAMTVVDIAGDLAVVLFLDGGMFLLGLATAIGQIVYFLVLMTHFSRKNRMLRFSLRGISGAADKAWAVIRKGSPAGIARISNAVSGILVNRILSAVAASGYIAAYSVHKSMGCLVQATYLGIADTVWLLSSIYYGEEDNKALDILQRTAIRVGLIITGIVMAVMAALPRAFAGIYISMDNPGAVALTAQAIQLFAFSIPLYLYVYCFDDYLMGTEKTRTANIYSFFLECGAVVPTVWIMTRLLGGRGAWFATPVALAVMAVAASVYISRWKYGDTYNVKRLLLTPDFGSFAGTELAISANTLLEIEGMSRIAELFCDENGIDRRRANAIALCIEELGTNIINHGFADGKEHSIDIRILVKDNDLILRIRDDGRPFNLVERYNMVSAQQEDVTKNIGIRMVMKMSTDVQYLNTMSTNNLIIRMSNAEQEK